jgi:hypothetical protein
MNLIISLATTIHLGFTEPLENLHPHILIEHEYFNTGIYFNSEGRVSPYLSYKSYTSSHYVEIGIVDGYSIGLMPLFRLGTELSDTSSIFISPGFDNYNINNPGLVFGIEIILKD